MAFFSSKPAEFKKLDVLSQPQLQAQRGLLQTGQQQLQNNPLSFAPQRAQYEKQFNEQVIPTLAERFAGNLSSGSFKGALGNTASDFYSKLGGLESQYNLQANQQGLQQLMAGLSPEFQNILQPGESSTLGNILSSLAQGAGAAGSAYLGGGLGGGASGILSLLQQLFSGGQQRQAQPLSFQSQMQNSFQPSQGNAVGSQQLMNLFQQLQQMLGGQ